jgi:hypothetical protein
VTTARRDPAPGWHVSDSLIPAEIGFLAEAELADLGRLEQTHDDVDALGAPARDLVGEPVPRARPARMAKRFIAGCSIQ